MKHIHESKKPVAENVRKELEPTNGRASFGRKAYVEDDGDGFTLLSYDTPVARIERCEDGNGQDFSLLNDYLSATTLTHIHSFLHTYGHKDIPTKELKNLDIGEIVHLDNPNRELIDWWNKRKAGMAESRKLVKEGAGYTEENLIGRKITTSYGADRDQYNARPATIVDAHRRRVSTGIVFDLIVELDDTGETIEQTFNPMSVGDKYTWGPWFRDGEERQYNPYEREYSESRKLVKEGAGAGYTVHIKDLKFGSIKEKKLVKGKERYDDYYECQVEILPGEYEIEAEDYYNDFFWQEHEFGETPTAKIDGGVATIVYSTNSYDEDEADMELHNELENQKMDIAFDYGWGWVHADLPNDKPIESDHVGVEGREFYGDIEKLELNAPDLAYAVNAGHQSIYDRDEEEEEDLDDENEDELVNESYDDERAEVGAAFDEFRGRLWKYTRKDRESRMEFFQDCMKKCEEAFKEYADMCVFD